MQFKKHNYIHFNNFNNSFLFFLVNQKSKDVNLLLKFNNILKIFIYIISKYISNKDKNMYIRIRINNKQTTRESFYKLIAFRWIKFDSINFQ